MDSYRLVCAMFASESHIYVLLFIFFLRAKFLVSNDSTALVQHSEKVVNDGYKMLNSKEKIFVL